MRSHEDRLAGVYPGRAPPSAMKNHEDRLAAVSPGRAPPAAMKHAGTSSYDSVTSQFELEFAGLDLRANPPPSQRRRAHAEAFLQEQQTNFKLQVKEGVIRGGGSGGGGLKKKKRQTGLLTRR